MTDEWKNRILQLTNRTDEAEDLEFVRLIDMAIGQCDLDTCKVLMKTFVTDKDYGVQESVVSALSSAGTEDYQIALLEELPRLIVDAPEWAEVLLEREVKNAPNSLRRSLAVITQRNGQVFKELVSSKFPDFKIDDSVKSED